jgi:hypothetical protein
MIYINDTWHSMMSISFVTAEGDIYTELFSKETTAGDARHILPPLFSFRRRILSLLLRNRKLNDSVLLSALRIPPSPGILITFFQHACPPVHLRRLSRGRSHSDRLQPADHFLNDRTQFGWFENP